MQKIKVTVNGIEWKDEIVSVKDRLIKNDEWLYQLKSGLIAPEGTISPIEPEIEPEPGDIVKVWDKGESPKVQIFDEMHNEVFSCLDFVGLSYTEWDYCRVLARKPKRWEDMNVKEQAKIEEVFLGFRRWDYYESGVKEAYAYMLSLLLNEVPYIRIDK
jgi:hypothetical protein